MTPPLASSTADAALPVAGRAWPLRMLTAFVAVAALVLVALALAWGGLQWLILPNLERWRGTIEQQVSLRVGLPVKIGAIRGHTDGFMPAIDVDDVVIQDASRREALRLKHVHASLSARSFLAFRPRFDRLIVDGARMDVRRDAQGRIHVAGIDIAKASGDGKRNDTSSADWLLAQREFVIRASSVRWTDEKRGAPTIALDPIELTLRRQRDGLHDLRLEATPPAAWGERFTLIGSFTEPLIAPHGDWRRWKGTLHADLPKADVEQLRLYVNLPFELNSGRGSLKAWLDVDTGALVGAVADVSLNRVDLRLAPQLDPLDIDRLEGRFVAKREHAGTADDATRVSLQGLTFTTRQGLAWPRGDVHLRLMGAPTRPHHGELEAQGIDLSVLSLVATRLPLAPNTRRLLTQAAPRGLAERFEASWQGPMDDPVSWRMRAGVRGLQLSPQRVPIAESVDKQLLGRPGIQGADVEFDATHEGGSATLAVRKGSLTFPGVFEQPTIDLSFLNAELGWKVLGAGRNGPLATKASGAQTTPMRDILVTAKSINFANADAQGTIEGSWRNGPGEGIGVGRRYPGVLDLKVTLKRGKATAVGRYLPLGMDSQVRRYVTRAFLAGEITDGTARVRGDLWSFPFRNRDGEFNLAAKVAGLRMNIAPDALAAGSSTAPRWPEIDQIDARVLFERTSMKIEDATGSLFGVALQDVQGAVNDFAHQPTLTIAGVAQGALKDMLRYVDRSPVGRLMGEALHETTAEGDARLGIRLSVPLRQLDRTTVHGVLTLDGNDLRIRPDVPAMQQARGELEFTEKGLTVRDATAVVLGGEARFGGGTQADGSLMFEGDGVISATGLAGATREFGELTKLVRVMKGKAPYHLQLAFHGPQAEFNVTSSLRGMQVDAPAPMGKAADSDMPMRVWTRLIPSAEKEPPSKRELLRIEVGPAFRAHYVRDLAGSTPAVIAGGIGIGDAAPQPDVGVQAIVKVDALDVDAWRHWLDRVGFVDEPTPSAAAAAAGAKAGLGYVPRTIALTAARLSFENRPLSNVTAGISHQASEGAWRATLDADQLAGYVQWRPPIRGRAAQVMARLSRLSLPETAVERVEALLADGPPQDPPSLDIIVDDFELRGRKLGRLELHAAQERTGEGAQAWRLNRLHASTPEAEFNATGQWSAPPTPGSRPRMLLDFELDVQDSGAYLDRFGIKDVIRAGSGQLSGQVSWEGSPLAWHLPSLDGKLRVNMASGQFLKVNAGAARLLGVLSLQSLPRRLMLDFRDVFAEGFAFDSVRGDLDIQDGLAHTGNLRMRGVQATVLMQGTADIQRETQDLNVWVVPEINAGAASLAYAAVNPAVGIGTFLAQLIFRRPMMEATTRQFRVTGPWTEPQVLAVQRRPGEGLPDLGAEAEPAQNKEDTRR